MNDISEGIGAAIEGTLVGRAVEPRHGDPLRDASAPHSCSNCGSQFVGSYCPHCGQKREIHRSLAAIGHDIVHGVLHLDGKLWNTLPLLAFKPGELTRRYIEGQRARFVSPMAMFLFSVFAMFAVFQMVGLGVPTNMPVGNAGSVGPDLFANELRRMTTELEEERSSLPIASPRRAEIDVEVKGLNELLDEETDKLGKVGGTGFTGTGIKWLDEGIIKKWEQNPSLMLYKLQANGYKFSWLLIPLSIPFVWLMFAWRRQFKAYDHAVFVTYSLAFMSLLFIGTSLASVAGLAGEWIAGFLLIAVPLHLYKHLRYSYGLRRFSALWRFSMLVIFIMIVLVLFLQALLVLGMY